MAKQKAGHKIEDVKEKVENTLAQESVEVDELSEDEKKTLADAEAKLAKEKELEEAKKVVELNDAQEAEAERELRRYVRREGGFRVGLPAQKIERAKFLMNRLNRDEPAWDEAIVLQDLPDMTAVIHTKKDAKK